MADHESIGQDAPRRGVAIKLLGVVLIILGVLDSMLSWRGGFALSESFIFLIAAGAIVYAIGAIRFGAEREAEPSPHLAEDRSLDSEIELSQRSNQAGSYPVSAGSVFQQTPHVERDSNGSERP